MYVFCCNFSLILRFTFISCISGDILCRWDSFIFTVISFHNVYFPVLSLIDQFSSVTQSCPTLCDPMNCSMPGLPVHHHLSEFTQTHVHRVHRPCKSFWHRTTMKHILSPYSHWRGTATLWGMSPLLAQGSGSTAPTIYRPPVPPEQALEEDTPSIQRDGTSINVWS